MCHRPNLRPVPDLSQSIADQQPSSTHFTEADDDRLRSIIAESPGDLSEAQWQSVAATFGGGKTAIQLQRRWNNYAKPGLDASPLSQEERRAIAMLSIEHAGQWTWIASHLGNGNCRSAAMVSGFARNFIPRLQKLKMAAECGRDIIFVPDAVFERHNLPRGWMSHWDRDALLSRFESFRAICANG
jgi:hypothetical protein